MSRMKRFGGRSNGNDYYRWLCKIISHDWQNRSYSLLLKQMHETPFVWLVDNDENRAKDALDLRAEYLGMIEDFSQVSVFEVLIALAEHIDDQMYDPDQGEIVERWFWMMVSNLGLDSYDDDHYNAGEIDYILYAFMNRAYDYNGNGGLFPLKSANLDQRKVEIWYQMTTYLLDNYVF